VSIVTGVRARQSKHFVSIRDRGKLERSRLRWEDTIKIDYQDLAGESWTGLIWLRIRTGGGRV
jgi:hypothetical protein